MCVEILVDISKICELKDRCDTLTKLLLVFLEDPNKWVKISAYKALGQFIATLEGGELNEKLFSHYMKMTDHSINYISNDNEVRDLIRPSRCLLSLSACFWATGGGLKNLTNKTPARSLLALV